MSDRTSASPEDRLLRRLDDAKLTPEQRAAVEARRADRETSEYKEALARDIDDYRREYPPIGDPELAAALAELRHERERQGLSLADVAERSGMDRATIIDLEAGRLADPSVGMLRNYARSLGRRLRWAVETAEVGNA